MTRDPRRGSDGTRKRCNIWSSLRVPLGGCENNEVTVAEPIEAFFVGVFPASVEDVLGDVRQDGPVVVRRGRLRCRRRVIEDVEATDAWSVRVDGDEFVSHGRRLTGCLI